MENLNSLLDSRESRSIGLFRFRKQIDSFELPPLLYEEDALAPILSKETVQFHYGKHTKGYFDKVRELVKGTEFENVPLGDIVRSSQGEIFNNAAQAWNHIFYWSCLAPKGHSNFDSNVSKMFGLASAIDKDFGSLDLFKEKFNQLAGEIFGSGWAWLVKTPSGVLQIESHKDAGNPIGNGSIPLLACDIWEHAYYIDYRNARQEYLANFWQIINWDFVAANFEDGISPLVH